MKRTAENYFQDYFGQNKAYIGRGKKNFFNQNHTLPVEKLFLLGAQHQ